MAWKTWDANSQSYVPKVDIASHTRNTGNAKNGTWTVSLTNGANINYTTVGWKTTWNVWWVDYTDAKAAVNAAKTMNAETAPAVNHAKGNFVDPSVLQDQLKNQQWGNENIANKWWNSAVEALDTYNKTYNNVTDESGNKVETATTDKLTGTPKVNQEATSTSTDEKWSFVSDYWDWSQSTTDVYWNTKVNKKFMENAEEAKRKAEAAAQAAKEEYKPEDTNWTQEDAAELNNNLDNELKSGITDQTNETLMNEIIESEKWPGAIETLAEETGIDLDSDAADYEDVDSIVNQSTYTSNVIDETPFDWWETREEPDYWEASRMWEQPVIYEKEIEEQEEEQNKWPLTNKRERDTTRIGRHW